MILSEDSCHSYFLSNVIWYIQFSPSVFVTKALPLANIIQPSKNVLVTVLFYGIRDWGMLGLKLHVMTKKAYEERYMYHTC